MAIARNREPAQRSGLSKITMVEMLAEKGYDAFLDSGIVMCRCRNGRERREIIDELERAGYLASYGLIGPSMRTVEMERQFEDSKLLELKNKGEVVYSISRIDSINNCLYGAYRKYILKDPEKPNVYSSLGGMVHQTLEDITNGKATEEDLLPSVRMEMDNLDALGIEFPKGKDGQDSIKENWITDMEHFCRTYKAPKGKDLRTERLFIYKTPDGHYLQGYIDLQMVHEDGSVSLYDYKTSTMYKGGDAKAHARQLILYALGVEQKGVSVRSASWIFLKYATVRFMGRKTARSKERTEIVKNIERRKIFEELKGYIEEDLKELGCNGLEIEMTLDIIEKSGKLDSLPEQVRQRYSIKPCVVSVDLTDEARRECIEYIQDTIKKWESLNPKNQKEYVPKPFTRIDKNGREVSDVFFCTALCGYFDKCGHIKGYLDSIQDEDDGIF